VAATIKDVARRARVSIASVSRTLNNSSSVTPGVRERVLRVGAGGAGRNLVVRGVRRDPPNMRKLARVVASLAATMLADETGQQPVRSEPDTSAASPRDSRRDAA